MFFGSYFVRGGSRLFLVVKVYVLGGFCISRRGVVFFCIERVFFSSGFVILDFRFVRDF